jgi:hypothetical protein
MSNRTASLEQSWKLIKHLNSDAKRCIRALQEARADDDEERSFWRRMYARAVFAIFDGTVYHLMSHAYVARHRRDVTFSLDELLRLEKSYDFDEDQEPSVTFSKAQMLEDIRFAFNAFARVHYSDYILPTHAREWALIKEIARIREVLQFPREKQSVEVYDGDLDALVEGLLWFVERMVELMESSQEHAMMKFAAWESDQDENEIIM